MNLNWRWTRRDESAGSAGRAILGPSYCSDSDWRILVRRRPRRRAADSAGNRVDPDEALEQEEEEESEEDTPVVCDRCFAQGETVWWQGDGTVFCVDCKAKEIYESEEEKTPSERTLRRNELQNEIAGLYANLEDMQTLEQNTAIAYTINMVEAQIAELQSQLEDLDATEELSEEDSSDEEINVGKKFIQMSLIRKEGVGGVHGDIEKAHAFEVDLEDGDIGAEACGHAGGIDS